MKRKGSLNLVREINISLILDVIKMKSPISKFEISKITKLSAPTVSKIIDDLIAIGFVKEVGTGESLGGRPPLLLELNHNSSFSIGVDIGVEITVIVVDFLGNEIVKEVTQLQEGINDFELLNKVITSITNIITTMKKDVSQFIGIGIGVSGEVDTKKGYIVNASRIKWKDVPIVSIIENSFQIPTYIEENVNLLTIAEKRYGAGKGYKDVFCLRIGEDLGSGIIINNELFYGSNGKAGTKIGHFIVDPDGEKCSCGKRGCLQTVASADAIIHFTKNMCKQATQDKKLLSSIDKQLDRLDVKLICELAEKNDEIALQVMERVSKYLAIAIYNVTTIIDPEIVIIGGGIAKSGDVLLVPLKRYLAEMNAGISNIHVVQSQLGSDSYAIGAATLVLNNLFSTPERFMKKLKKIKNPVSPPPSMM